MIPSRSLFTQFLIFGLELSYALSLTRSLPSAAPQNPLTAPEDQTLHLPLAAVLNMSFLLDLKHELNTFMWQYALKFVLLICEHSCKITVQWVQIKGHDVVLDTHFNNYSETFCLRTSNFTWRSL